MKYVAVEKEALLGLLNNYAWLLRILIVGKGKEAKKENLIATLEIVQKSIGAIGQIDK